MSRKLQTSPNLKRKYKVLSFGTSQTSLESCLQYGVASINAAGPRLQERLNFAGANVEAITLGRGGDTSAQAIGRAFELNRYGTPDIGIIEMGVNDVFANINGISSTGTPNTVTLDSNASSLINSYVGSIISITSGTGSGQSKTIINYSISKIATVDSNWTTIPDSTSAYSIAIPTTSQLQANDQALIKILKYNVRSTDVDENGSSLLLTVWNQSLLPKLGNIGQRLVVMNDNSTTGGVAANHSSMRPKIAGDYSSSPKQSVWEYRNPLGGEAGWGRVAINSTPAFSDGCSKIIFIGSNYQNWVTGGDSYNVTTSTGTQYTPYISVRQAAKDAVIQEAINNTDVVYCDLYYFESTLIYGGVFLGNTILTETSQGSGDFHYINTNQHYSAYGHDVKARALYYQIVYQGWLSSIS